MKDSYLGLLALGEGHYLPLEEVALIAPIGAIEAISQYVTVDTTRHRRPLAVILTRSDRVLLSDLTPEVIAERYAQARLTLAGG